jgi:plasmid stability protein
MQYSDAKGTTMKPITLRNLPEEVARIIRQRAATEGLSLNRAVITALQELFAAARPASQHHDLDDLAGAWSAEEGQAFDRALAAQRAIDPELWR